MRLEKETINIGKQERQGMTFISIFQVKDLNCLQNEFLFFSYDQYEKMAKLSSVDKTKVK